MDKKEEVNKETKKAVPQMLDKKKSLSNGWGKHTRNGYSIGRKRHKYSR